RDLDAETAEAAGGLHLHLAVALGVEEGTVRIEAAQCPLDGVVDQILRGNFVHVLVLDDGKDLGEQPELFVRGRVVRYFADRGAAQREREHHEQRADHESLLHGFPLRATYLNLAAGAIALGPAACPGSGPRSRAADPPASPCLRPFRSADLAARRRLPSPGSRPCARTACSTRCRDPG